MRAVLVTGVSTGIGRAIAEELLESDFIVIGSVRKESDAKYFHEKYNDNFKSVIFDVTKKDEIFAQLNVWLGKKNRVDVVASEDLYLTIPKRKKQTIKAVIEYEGPIESPIKKNQKLGVLNVYISGELHKKIDILSAEDIKRSNIFSRLFKSLNYLVWGDA